MAISSVSSSSYNSAAALLKQPATGDQKADVGLQDRDTTPERIGKLQSSLDTVVQNHGFAARMSTQEALTNNTKIINTPANQRGSLLDISA